MHLNHPIRFCLLFTKIQTSYKSVITTNKAERNYLNRSVYQDNKPIKNPGTLRN